MTLGPFIIRELRISSRRGRMFVGRATSAATVLAIIGCVGLVWSYFHWDRGSVGGIAGFAFQTFAAIVAVQAMGTCAAIPSVVSPRIAGERERRSLDALLASRLSSAEIVVGTTAEGVLPYLSGLAVVFPIVLLMVPLGGIDPWLVALAFGGLLSTAFFLAALSAAVSAGARDRRAALSWAVGLSWAWMTLPFLAVMIAPRVWSGASRWTAPVALVALESSPFGVMVNLGGVLRRCGPIEAILRMIGLQVAGGVLLLAWAIVRLRPASRAAYDAESRTTWLLQMSRSRRRRWPPCGDDPVFWRERYSQPDSRRILRIVGWLAVVSFLGFLAFGTYWFATPAFQEVLAHGYGAAADPAGGPETGQARSVFNTALRYFTVFWDLIYVLSLGGLAAAGIATERARDTWPSLLATPLSGGEIVLAKMRGAAWRTREAALVLVALWTAGLVAGAVHPLGYAAALAGLGISTWFLVALGAFLSLRAPDANRAINQNSSVVGFMVFSALVPFVLAPSGWSGSVLFGSASAPLQAGLSLVSFEDVRVALRTGGFPALETLGFATGEGAWAVLAAWLIGSVGQAIAAAFLTRAAIDEFDEAVGRPVRSPGAPCHPPARWR